MIIRCRSSKRFLLNINVEEYYNSLKKMGIDTTLPLIIDIPCSRCRLIEQYEIYPNAYKYVKSYRYENTKK